jgi:hypothetical protein
LAATGVVALIGVLVVAVLDDSPTNDDGGLDRKGAATTALGAAPAADEPAAAPPAAQPTPEGQPAKPGQPSAVVLGSAAQAPAEAPVAAEHRTGTSAGTRHGDGGRGGTAAERAASGKAGSAAVASADKDKGKGKTSPRGTGGEGAAGAGGASGTAKKDGPSGSSGEPSRRGAPQRGPFGGSGPERVARFVASGGANLKGQVVDADTGKALASVTVEAHLDSKVMETVTEANGAFHMVGLMPNRRVTVWIIGKNEAFVAEYMEIPIPGEGETADVGVTRLLRGSELAGRIAGWVGVFMGRGDRRNVVTAVNPWLPADRAGIQPGDAVLAIDGRNVEGLGPRATTFLLRGPVGSKTMLSIKNRDGEVRKIELERVSR